MNRPIKFRVWDKLIKKMMGDQPWIPFDNPEYVFMQYTGLNDKNGMEIYEGDIVIGISGNIDNPVFYETIKWSANGSFVSIRFFEEKQSTAKNIDVAKARTWEVVGNIFETPELIDKV